MNAQEVAQTIVMGNLSRAREEINLTVNPGLAAFMICEELVHSFGFNWSRAVSTMKTVVGHK